MKLSPPGRGPVDICKPTGAGGTPREKRGAGHALPLAEMLFRERCVLLGKPAAQIASAV
jgi:hypothetical protein